MYWMTQQFPYPDDNIMEIDFRFIISTSVTFQCASELDIANLQQECYNSKFGFLSYWYRKKCLQMHFNPLAPEFSFKF
jgi:hypothetical protein